METVKIGYSKWFTVSWFVWLQSVKLPQQDSHAPWKSPGKRKIMEMSCKNPGNSLKIHAKLELSSFLEDLWKHTFTTNYCPGKSEFRPWKVLEKSLKSPWKWIYKSVGTLQRKMSKLKKATYIQTSSWRFTWQLEYGCRPLHVSLTK